MADMNVTAKFSADISDMRSKMDQITKSLGNIESKSNSMGKGFTFLRGTLATAFGTAITGGITAAAGAMANFATGSVAAADEAFKATARLDQIASSIGALDGVLGGSTQRLQDFASNLSMTIGVEDEAIMASQALLMTFSNVANTAGEVGGVFDRATVAAADLAAAGFGSLDSNAKMLGKALQDPTRGMTALTRAGVTFSQAQKDQIEAMTESNNIAGAQALIMAEVEKQIGGTAAAVATDADKMKVAFSELQETIGVAMFPVIQELAKTLTPVIQSLQGPLGQIAATIGGALAQAFQAIAPLLPPLVSALTAVGQAVTTALAGALQSIIPALIPVAQNLGTLATQIAPLLANVLGRVGEVFGRVLGAVTPLLGPLTNLVMGILNAAWPIIDIVATMLLDLVDALIPVLDAVMALLTPLGELIEVLLAAIMPVLEPIIPLFKVLAEVVGTILTKAIGLLMVGLGTLIQGLAKVAPFVMKNVTAPVVKAFLDMAKGVVGAAADMLGWVPGLGDKLREAETAIGNFATETEKNIKKAGDTIEAEGTRIGQNMVTAGTNALNQASGPLGAAAAQTGAYVAGQYNEAMLSGMRYQAMADAAKPPALPKPPPPPPGPTTPTGGKSGTGKTADADKKAVEELTTKLEEWKTALEGVKTASDNMYAATHVLPAELQSMAGALDGLVQTEVQQAFGPGGGIDSIVGGFNNLASNINDFYKPLLNVELFGKKAVKSARAAFNDAKNFLKQAAQTALSLMAQRELNKKALADLDKDYSDAVTSINKNYDALDKAANDNLKAIESKWEGIIPGLEKALSKATEAFDKENGVLQDLISKRNEFLGQIRSGFRSFVNSLSFDSANAGKQIIRETQTLANGITVTFEREIAGGSSASGIRQAFESRLQAVRDFASNVRTLIARGLDPTLIQEFVSAGVAGAGEAVAALSQASDSDLAAINAAQAGLASEVAAFQQTASAQWFDAGIAQQAAIVAPLEAAKNAAQSALDTANALRTQEINAAKAHQERLKVDREAALAAELANYTTRKDALIAEGKEIDTQLQANADSINAKFTNLNTTLPPEMRKIGRQSINGLIGGLKTKEPELLAEARRIGEAVAAELRRALQVRSPSQVTKEIGMEVARGLAVGMNDGSRLVVASAGDLGMGAVPDMGPRSSSGGTIVYNNYTVNVQSLAGDKRQIGREVVEAIKAFERTSGPVYAPAVI